MALDWRGQGQSAWLRPPAYRTEDLVADLLRIADRLRLDPLAVAGHSMGGHIALVFAAWHPDRLPRDSCQQKIAESKLKEINVAYDRVRSYSGSNGRNGKNGSDAFEPLPACVFW